MYSIRLAVLGLALCWVVPGQSQEIASGEFAPIGPPTDGVVRTPAGDACIVDLVQAYEIHGSLTGTLEIDYRIFVAGPCGSPPGTFRESWIAHGTFTGAFNGDPTTADLWYLADVDEDGALAGTMGFSNGLSGELTVSGRFSDRRLSYRGPLRQ